MRKHKKHNPPDLEEGLEHIVYEIWKFRQSVAYYDSIRRVGGDAAIEFRVLHHRVLLEFFFGPPKHRDNIVAWEYIDDWEQRYDRSTLPWLDGYLKRCHTMLAHISKTRSDLAKNGSKDWGAEWELVEPFLNEVVADFLNGLDDHHRAICRQWVIRWLNGSHPGNEILKPLSVLVT